MMKNVKFGMLPTLSEILPGRNFEIGGFVVGTFFTIRWVNKITTPT